MNFDFEKISFEIISYAGEDQLLTSETFIVFATEIIEIYKNK